MAYSGYHIQRRGHVRPTSYWDVVCHHLPVALVTGIPLILAFISTPESLPLKDCTFKALTGYPCPFCGFTRSFCSMASGDWVHAFYSCPLGAVFFLGCVVAFAWSLLGLFTGMKLSIPKFFKAKPDRGKYLGSAIVLLFVLNWGYRLCEGLK